MARISKRTLINYILVIIWIFWAFVDMHKGENYGGFIFKIFAPIVFFFIATYNFLVDIGKIKPIGKKNKRRCALITIITVVAFASIVFGNYDIEINNYKVKSAKIPESFDGFRIVQISDLHNAEFDKHNSSILERIFHSHPDIIVITGDMIDSRRTDVDVAISFAQKAVKIAPVYYANGNHESRILKEYEQLKQGLEDAGVTILEDDSIEIKIGNDAISIAGINDPSFKIEQNTEHQLMRVIPKNDNYKVLLAHKPHYFDVYAGKVDLVFSGHAHGGQFRIPFIGGFIAPGQGFFPEYYEGSYIKNNTEMIVSRGVGNSIIPVRINNRPEIIVAELTKIKY